MEYHGSAMPDHESDLPDTAPLFPLADTVLFPGAWLPLHIFEPRYRAMTAAAIRGRPYIAIALLKPGYEDLYYTRVAPIHPVVGLGRLTHAKALADGRFNIILLGVGRMRVVSELPGEDGAHRVARLAPLSTTCDALQENVRTLRDQLAAAVRRSVVVAELRQHWLRLLDEEPDLGALCDRLAASLPVPGMLRQELLAETDAARRATQLRDCLKLFAPTVSRARPVYHEPACRLN
jgi:Lon protease-like protein